MVTVIGTVKGPPPSPPNPHTPQIILDCETNCSKRCRIPLRGRAVSLVCLRAHQGVVLH